MDRENNTEYVLSLSYGKDSLACLGAIQELGWPLDRIVHVEVWATDTIPADLPPMMEFKKKADKIIKDRFGIEVEHVCATRTVAAERERERERESTQDSAPQRELLTYEKLFYHVPKRKSKSALMGRRLDFQQSECHGVQECSNKVCSGFPLTRASWCKKLKDGNYTRLPYHQGKLVYRAQDEGFLRAP